MADDVPEKEIIMDDSSTTRFVLGQDKQAEAAEIMRQVLAALEEKGYNPVSQLVGYFLSDDPTYITNYANARGVIRRMERDELLEVILQKYIGSLRQDG